MDPEHHRDSRKTGISSCRLGIVSGRILLCVLSDCPFFLMRGYSMLWQAWSLRGESQDSRNALVQSSLQPPFLNIIFLPVVVRKGF